MNTHSSLPPGLIVLIALSAIGIVFVLLSRSVATKRIVLPATLIAFHVTVFVAFKIAGAFPNIPSVVIIAVLTANALLTWWMITYCATCGRTIGRGSGGRCPSCARANGGQNPD